MDVTTFFLIPIVAVLINGLFNTSFGFYGILLFMILGGGLLGNAQYRKRGAVDGKRIFRTVWRLSFFILSFLYILIMIIELLKMMFTVS